MRATAALLLLPIVLFAVAASADEGLAVDIPAQPLNSALENFAEQSGLQVVYLAEVAQGVKTDGFSGEATVEDTLAAILDGTGLAWRFENERTVSIARNESSGSSASEDSSQADQESDSDDSDSGNDDEDSSEDSDEQAVESVSDEILVTAQLRKQTLREVPVSVTAITGDSLDRQGIVSLREVARITPGFASSTFNESEPIFAVRGATNTFSQAGTSKPVGVFLDGVYISRNSGSAFDLYDLEQVEILRGPQGTLFGRNVTGGAILLTTTKPPFGDPKVKLDLGAGNHGSLELRGLVGGQLGEKAAGKLAATVRQRDGYARERLLDVEQNDLDTTNLRAQVSFLLGEQGLLTLTGDYADDQNNGRTLSTVTPAAANDGNIRTSESGHKQTYKRDITSLSAHLDWTTGSGQLQSITALRESDTFENFAFSSTAFQFLPRFNPFFPFQQIGINADQPETLSQELRFLSDAGERFDYVVGLYYFDEDIRRQSTSIRLGGATGDTIRNQTFDQSVDTQSLALYADFHLELSDNVHLNLGGRFTDEEKEVQVNYTDLLAPFRNFQSDRFRASWSEFTPRAALTWRPNESVSVFASATQGFTAGGFNTEEDTPSVIGRPFDPETLTAYELGVKTEWQDRRVRLNATVFSQQFKDKQEGFLDPTFNFVIVNAAEATMEGLEADLFFAATDRLQLSAVYSILDATYDDFFIARTMENRSGNFLSTAPENSMALAADYRAPLAQFGELAFHLDYSTQDDYFTGSDNRPTFLIDSYDLINASVSVASASGLWRLTAWARNLADEEYVLIRSDFGLGGVGEHYGVPRTYGLRLTLTP